ncbi:hypothetical protein DFLDMN_006427 (plasmid) [Cupriavidus sp. H19C3]|uniref:hypothetical protein n=1 Tax=Cupriavidus sp. H19C3 TaxID=3241603 RepID=UPI003BF91662
MAGKISTFRIGVALWVLTGLQGATAQEYAPDYRCTVERFDGADHDDRSRAEFYKGKTFSVHRRTGLIVGGIGELKNSYAADQQPQVVDYGRVEMNSFKAVTIQPFSGSGGSNVYLLVIDEYVNRTLKPFMFSANDRVWFGHCTHAH